MSLVPSAIRKAAQTRAKQLPPHHTSTKPKLDVENLLQSGAAWLGDEAAETR